MMMRNLRGEMTVMHPDEDTENQDLDVVSAISRALRLSSRNDVERIKDLLVPTLFFTAVVNGDIKRLEEIFSNVSYKKKFNDCDVYFITYLTIVLELTCLPSLKGIYIYMLCNKLFSRAHIQYMKQIRNVYISEVYMATIYDPSQ